MKIYFISGLGSDERVFRFLDLPGFDTRYIRWEKTIKGESMEDPVSLFREA